MKINGLTDVFFDLDHTLWDFDKNSALTFEKIFKMNSLNIHLESFLQYYEPINLKYWKLFREEQIDKASLRYRRLADTFDKLGISVNDNIIDKLSEDYIDHLSSFNHLFDDTIHILDYLKPKYKLHIITNGFKEVQEGKLQNSKISHYFNTVTNSEIVGVKKPNPKVFNFALNLAQADVETSIMIGDNYEADILGALNVGFDVIHFNYHDEEVDKNIKQITNLLDLKTYL
ncbi:YjjG family noncanonical pyrimidine nucleotidase [Flavobacteriaceae bacterium MJ-SS4]|uniref:YjjG family noncanonical pyrimidine nucleotidase n=1 Tax=Gilvirhabdus luticola TaxID=3079858 RepID=UPI0032DC5F85